MFKLVATNPDELYVCSVGLKLIIWLADNSFLSQATIQPVG